MSKKYEILLNEATEINGKTLYPIKALKDFGNVKAGELGGYIEKESNLSHTGNCWVREQACVCGNAEIMQNAQICGRAHVFGNAKIYGNARIFQNAWVSEYTHVFDNAEICGDTYLSGNSHIGLDAVIEKKNDCISLCFNDNGNTTTFFSTEKGVGVAESGQTYTIDEYISYLIETYGINSKTYNDFVLLIQAMKSKLGGGKFKRNIYPVD